MITLRRDLDRPLTAEEVDENFWTLLNMINGTFEFNGFRVIRINGDIHAMNIVGNGMYDATNPSFLVYEINYKTMVATNVSGQVHPDLLPAELFIVEGEGLMLLTKDLSDPYSNLVFRLEDNTQAM